MNNLIDETHAEDNLNVIEDMNAVGQYRLGNREKD